MNPLAQALGANFPQLRLNAAQLERLAMLLPQRRLAAGGLLFAQGQASRAFYMVAEGEIETRFTALDGRVSVLEHVAAPRIFGLAAFVSGQPCSYEAAASAPTRLWLIDAAAYRYMMDELPGFARALLAEFARRYDGTLRLLEAARHRPAPERLALALQQLQRERGEPADAQGWVSLRATQAELAQLANLSRQTVNELLRQALEQGRLRKHYGRLWLRADAVGMPDQAAPRPPADAGAA
jgi:CRP/FNR family transcriptional regulator, cyclic AMP receptor protein